MSANARHNILGTGLYSLVFALAVGVLCLCSMGCSSNTNAPGPVAISGVKEVKPVVQVGQDGMTSEQRNVLERLKRDNAPGSIKHLYVFSAYSGQCLIYSTVKGKVTSSGKRLSPTTVYAGMTEHYNKGIPVAIAGQSHLTSEVLQDDGTYGDSIKYLYWFDQRGVYQQQYVQGGTFIHISEEPMPVKSIIINIEAAAQK